MDTFTGDYHNGKSFGVRSAVQEVRALDPNSSRWKYAHAVLFWRPAGRVPTWTGSNLSQAGFGQSYNQILPLCLRVNLLEGLM